MSTSSFDISSVHVLGLSSKSRALSAGGAEIDLCFQQKNRCHILFVKRNAQRKKQLLSSCETDALSSCVTDAPRSH